MNSVEKLVKVCETLGIWRDIPEPCCAFVVRLLAGCWLLVDLCGWVVEVWESLGKFVNVWESL